jgi:hypothetical protein
MVPFPAARAERASHVVYQDDEARPQIRSWTSSPPAPAASLVPEPTLPFGESP